MLSRRPPVYTAWPSARQRCTMDVDGVLDACDAQVDAFRQAFVDNYEAAARGPYDQLPLDRRQVKRTHAYHQMPEPRCSVFRRFASDPADSWVSLCTDYLVFKVLEAVSVNREDFWGSHLDKAADRLYAASVTFPADPADLQLDRLQGVVINTAIIYAHDYDPCIGESGDGATRQAVKDTKRKCQQEKDRLMRKNRTLESKLATKRSELEACEAKEKKCEADKSKSEQTNRTLRSQLDLKTAELKTVRTKSDQLNSKQKAEIENCRKQHDVLADKLRKMQTKHYQLLQQKASLDNAQRQSAQEKPFNPLYESVSPDAPSSAPKGGGGGSASAAPNADKNDGDKIYGSVTPFHTDATVRAQATKRHVEELEQAKETLESQIKTSEQEIEQLRQQITTTKTTAEEEADRLRAAAQKSETEAAKLREQLSDASAKAKQADKMIEELQSGARRITSRGAGPTANNELVAGARPRFTDKENTLISELRTLQDALAERDKKVQTLSAQLAKVPATLRRNEQFAKLNKELVDSAEKLESLLREARGKEQALVDEIENLTKAGQRGTAIFEETTEKLNWELGRYVHITERLEQTLSTQQQRIIELEHRARTKDDDRAELEAELKFLRANQKTVSELEETIKSLEADLKSATQRVADFPSPLRASTPLDASSFATSDNSAELAELTEKVEDLQKKNAELRKRLDVAPQAIDFEVAQQWFLSRFRSLTTEDDKTLVATFVFACMPYPLGYEEEDMRLESIIRTLYDCIALKNEDARASIENHFLSSGILSPPQGSNFNMFQGALRHVLALLTPDPNPANVVLQQQSTITMDPIFEALREYIPVFVIVFGALLKNTKNIGAAKCKDDIKRTQFVADKTAALKEFDGIVNGGANNVVDQLRVSTKAYSAFLESLVPAQDDVEVSSEQPNTEAVFNSLPQDLKEDIMNHIIQQCELPLTKVKVDAKLRIVVTLAVNGKDAGTDVLTQHDSDLDKSMNFVIFGQVNDIENDVRENFEQDTMQIAKGLRLRIAASLESVGAAGTATDFVKVRVTNQKRLRAMYIAELVKVLGFPLSSLMEDFQEWTEEVRQDEYLTGDTRSSLFKYKRELEGTVEESSMPDSNTLLHVAFDNPYLQGELLRSAISLLQPPFTEDDVKDLLKQFAQLSILLYKKARTDQLSSEEEAHLAEFNASSSDELRQLLDSLANLVDEASNRIYEEDIEIEVESGSEAATFMLSQYISKLEENGPEVVLYLLTHEQLLPGAEEDNLYNRMQPAAVPGKSVPTAVLAENNDFTKRFARGAALVEERKARAEERKARAETIALAQKLSKRFTDGGALVEEKRKARAETNALAQALSKRFTDRAALVEKERKAPAVSPEQSASVTRLRLVNSDDDGGGGASASLAPRRASPKPSPEKKRIRPTIVKNFVRPTTTFGENEKEISLDDNGKERKLYYGKKLNKEGLPPPRDVDFDKVVHDIIEFDSVEIGNLSKAELVKQMKQLQTIERAKNAIPTALPANIDADGIDTTLPSAKDDPNTPITISADRDAQVIQVERRKDALLDQMKQRGESFSQIMKKYFPKHEEATDEMSREELRDIITFLTNLLPTEFVFKIDLEQFRAALNEEARKDDEDVEYMGDLMSHIRSAETFKLLTEYTDSTEKNVLEFVVDFADELNAYRNYFGQEAFKLPFQTEENFEKVISTVRGKPGYEEFEKFITQNYKRLKTLIRGKDQQEKLFAERLAYFALDIPADCGTDYNNTRITDDLIFWTFRYKDEAGFKKVLLFFEKALDAINALRSANGEEELSGELIDDIRAERAAAERDAAENQAAKEAKKAEAQAARKAAAQAAKAANDAALEPIFNDTSELIQETDIQNVIGQFRNNKYYKRLDEQKKNKPIDEMIVALMNIYRRDPPLDLDQRRYALNKLLMYKKPPSRKEVENFEADVLKKIILPADRERLGIFIPDPDGGAATNVGFVDMA